MLKKLNKSNQGFTIIEVLIVLAIAALILLIVFLAVPALQRNTRNTTRKQDAGRVAAAVNNYVSNHNGTAPPSDTQANAAAAADEILKDAGDLGQYPGMTISGTFNQAQSNKLAIANALNADPAYNATVTVDGFQVVTSAKCNTSGNGQFVAGSARNLVIRYVSENGNGTFSGHCQDI